MKKQVLLLIVACLACGAARAFDFSDEASTGQTLYYNITGDGVVELTSEIDGYPYFSSVPTGSLVIPATVTYNGNEYAVTAVGSYAFYSCCGLTSVTFPRRRHHHWRNGFR